MSIYDDTVFIHAGRNENLYRNERESIMDHSWIKNTFIIGDSKEDRYNKWLHYNRFFSSADIKSGGTSPGMSIAINPLPQITRYADIRRPGTIRSRDGISPMRKTGVPAYRVNTEPGQFGLGYGRYYSEAIDDNQQRIFLRFGEPQFTSMLLWLGRSFDVHKAILFRRGIITRVLISVVYYVTMAFTFWSRTIVFLKRLFLRFILQPDKFISVRDNMYTYWMMVETIMNKLYVKRTNVPFIYTSYGKAGSDTSIGKAPAINEAYVKSLSELLPGIVDEQTGRISVWALALRGQSAFNRSVYEQIDDDRMLEDSDPSDYTLPDDPGDDRLYDFTRKSVIDPGTFTKWLLKKSYDLIASEQEDRTPSWAYEAVGTMQEVVTGFGEMLGLNSVDIDGEEEFLDYSVPLNETATTPEGVPLSVNIDSNEIADSADYQMEVNDQRKKKTYSRYGEYLMSLLNSGAAFLVLNVDTTGSVGESFSNSADTNPIETIFNSISSKIRGIMNTLSSAFEIPLIGDGIKLIADAGISMVSAATAGLANPLLALAYSTTISLPKSWSSSSASLPRATYKLKLTTPYGNPYSQLFYMYFPLAALLAGSLPRATGSDSHTAPFMLQLFDRGRVNIHYGMVESLSITRGTSNLAFTRSGHPNAIDVDLGILDLNQLLTIDVSGNSLLTRVARGLYIPRMDDTSLDYYIDTLVGQDVYNMVYKLSKYRIRFLEALMTKRSTQADPAAKAAFTVRWFPFVGTISEAVGQNYRVLAAQQ